MDDPAAALSGGKLGFVLRGERLRGGWDLVLMKSRPRERQPQWLLVKRRDEEADARRRPTSTQPESVVSGRRIDEL